MRILVVEDEKRLAEKIRRGLIEEGYAIDTAFNGEYGEELLGQIHYDLIILDIILPGKNGISVCQTIRQKKLDTPVLILTAKDSIDDKIKGLDCGADDYLTKPFDFEELYARVRALLRREQKDFSSKMQIGELVMDTAARKVWRGGDLVDVTSKEYSVLECLMRHPHAVITRLMIEQHVRDIELDTSYNLVDVYICKLRAKLDRPGQASFIETVRGTGYRLRAN